MDDGKRRNASWRRGGEAAGRCMIRSPWLHSARQLGGGRLDHQRVFPEARCRSKHAVAPAERTHRHFSAAISFRESFGRLMECRLGDRQRDILHDAVVQSLQQNNPCELRHIKDKLEEIYDDRDLKEDSVISTMRDVCRFSIFEPTYDAETFFSKSWMVKLPPNIPADIRSIVVNLTLDALDRYLNSLPDAPVSESDGSRRLRILCVVDEAHYVLKTKLLSLSTLVRLSRSKGSSIMLISQSPDDFSK